LPGNSSPVVWGDRIFLTGADEQTREVFCFDARSGELLWRQAVPGTPESTATVPKVMEATGYAAPTPATDGRRVYAIFANGDLGAFDFEGRLRWSRSLGIPKNAYGHASSLAMFQDLLIVQFDQGIREEKRSRLLALRGATGETVWETVREVPNSWATPIVIQVDGQPQIITSADPWVLANSPADGSEIWRADCLRGDVGPSPVFAGGMVFTANEFPGLAAIRADGTGDVTETHVAWEADLGAPDTASPLATEKFVFLLASYGILTCYDAREGGDPLWEQEFDASFVSSPTLIGNLMFLFGEDGKVYIVEPTADECRVVAENDLGEECVTSPAVVDGRIFIRGKEHLIGIGQKP
jgi:outer membrane protein assembly factor BamB